MVIYKNKEFKTAINKLKFPDSWFWARYTINPYSGCEHACIYCDARSQRYYLEDFENEVIIKKNIDKKLDHKIKNARKFLPDVIAAGGVNDAYQQIEMEVKNTRKILKILAKYKLPVNIATKSDLVTRDIDLFRKIANDTWCTIGFSITTLDENLAKFLEPFSSTPEERLEALKTIKCQASNVQVGTYFMPIIPFLEDNEENLKAVIKESKEAKADFLLFSPGLTMRDLQAEYFLKK
ncbi:MAG: radical SAM protein, partial [Promethearchaeota archaeon]